MKLKHAVMVGMLGKISDRFHTYQADKSLEERLDMAARVEGADGIEIVYPPHFDDVERTIKLIKDKGLTVSALNLNVKAAPQWGKGSFTAPDPETRAAAVGELKFALDLAAELGTDMVTCCPLIDGHNYSFQVDYLKQWTWLEEGIAEGLKHRDDIRLSLEYKLNESCNFNVLADMGRTLYLCERLGVPYVGVTMDVGHALIAREVPAESLSIAALADRLFYVHFNDNDRGWDWDMLPGSVNFWDLLEMVFYLDRLNWEGWLSYDVITRHGDQVESMGSAIAMVNMALELVEKIGRETLEGFIEKGIPAPAFRHMMKKFI
jgi:xylose isomerase